MNKEVQNQLSRMKSMMTYGLTAENKNCQFSNVEFDKVAADGKHYAIIREGSKYYIKVSDKKDALREDYNYIGGFCNRSKNEYQSYANALKQFELKMMSIQENYAKNKGIVIESWNPYKKEELTIEATEKMRKEIARQKEIINNATKIFEGKNVSTTIAEDCCIDKECAASQKNNIKKTSDGKGEPTGNGGDPFTKSSSAETSKTQKTNVKKEFKPVMNEEETLAWNDNKDYLDTTHGTEVGDDAPFTKAKGNTENLDNGVVEECGAMHACDNQNCPSVGVGEIGDDAPFEEKAKNELQEGGFFHNDSVSDDEQLEELPDEIQLEDEELDDVEMDDVEDFDSEVEDDTDSLEDDDLDLDVDYDTDIDDTLESDTMEDDDVKSRLAAIEDAIAKISEKLGVNDFEDDDLYDDETEDVDDELEFEIEPDIKDDDVESDDTESKEPFEEGKKWDKAKEFGKKTLNKAKNTWDKAKKKWDEEEAKVLAAKNPMYWGDDDDDEINECQIIETPSYRRMMNEEGTRLDMFGKHPAYQKQVMSLPSNKHQEMNGYYDMNDDSVESEAPFGQHIGDGAPFEQDIQSIENAIAEAVKRVLGKRKNL